MKEICGKKEEEFQSEIHNLRALLWKVAMKNCRSVHSKGTANATVRGTLRKLFHCDSKEIYGEVILTCDS
jgi:hypothetical protein